MNWNSYSMGLWIFSYIFLTTHLLIKHKKKYGISFIRIFIFAFLYMINFTYSEPLTSFAIYILLSFLFVFFEFRKNNQPILPIIITIYLIRFIFELLFYITLTILHIPIPSLFFLNKCTTILSFLAVLIFQNYIKEIINIHYIYKNKSLLSKIILNNIGLFLVTSIRLTHYQIHSNLHLYMNLFLFIIIINLVFILFHEKEKNNDLEKNYNKMVEYSEFTEGLLTEYKSFVHEYKNKLLIIKSLTDKKNKELQKYIDTLLEEKVVNHYRWLSELKNIPIAGAKGLINFKLLQMKELKIDVEIYISEEIAKIKDDFLTSKEKNDLYTLLGIILDNAIEASLESNEKMISLHFYKEKETIVFLLANTFKHIALDRMEEKGFSSKGDNRGMGLYIFQNIIKYSDTFSKETSVIDNFFVQKILIKKCK